MTALFVSACSATGGAPTAAAPGTAQIAAAPDADWAAESAHTALVAIASAPAVAVPSHVAFGRLRMHPNAGDPPFLIGFVTAGEAQGGVPCISCVNGAQTGDNIGLSGPGNYVPASATWQYTLSFTNMAFTGKCKLDWAITSGAKTIDAFSYDATLTQTGGFFLYGIDRNRPKYNGKALLTGTVKCGGGPIQTVTAPLIFD